MTVDTFGPLNDTEERETVRNLALSGNADALAGHSFTDAKNPLEKNGENTKKAKYRLYRAAYILNTMQANASTTPIYNIKIGDTEYNDKQIEAALDTAQKETTQEIERLEKNIEDMRERGESPRSVDARAVDVLKQYEKKQEIEKAKEAVKDPEKMEEILKESPKIEEIIKEKAPPKEDVAEAKESTPKTISVAPEEDALNEMEIKEHFASAAMPSAQTPESTSTMQPTLTPKVTPEAFT